MPDGDRSSQTARSLSERISDAISSGADADAIADQHVSAATNAAVSAIGQGLDHDAQTLQDPHASPVDKGLAGLDLAATAPAVVPGLQGEFAAKVLATNSLRLGLKALKVDALIHTASTVVGGAGAHIAEAVQRTGVRKFAEHVFGHDIGAQANQAAQHGVAHAGSGLPKAAHPPAPSVAHQATPGRFQHVERSKPLTPEAVHDALVQHGLDPHPMPGFKHAWHTKYAVHIYIAPGRNAGKVGDETADLVYAAKQEHLHVHLITHRGDEGGVKAAATVKKLWVPSTFSEDLKQVNDQIPGLNNSFRHGVERVLSPLTPHHGTANNVSAWTSVYLNIPSIAGGVASGMALGAAEVSKHVKPDTVTPIEPKQEQHQLAKPRDGASVPQSHHKTHEEHPSKHEQVHDKHQRSLGRAKERTSADAHSIWESTRLSAGEVQQNEHDHQVRQQREHPAQEQRQERSRGFER